MSYNGFEPHQSAGRVCLYFPFSLIVNLMLWTPPPSLPNLLCVSIPVVRHLPKPEVHHVQGYLGLMSAGSEIEVSRAPHEWVHVYQLNYLSLVPFMFSLYIHYFPDFHVFHGFPVIGCLQNVQQQKKPDQIQKDLYVLYVLQDFHFRARFPHQYSGMRCFGAKQCAPLYPRLCKEQCSPPPSQKKPRE
jgi:hypothetical protein